MKRFSSLIVLCMVAGPPALAGPSWTPQTYQLFDFLPNDFSGSPVIQPGAGAFGSDLYTYNVKATVDQNPFGDPFARVKVDTAYDGIGDVSGGYSASGDYFHAWAISVGSGMWIPNADVPNPLKNIWVEIRYDPVLVDYHVDPPDNSYVVDQISFHDVPEDPTKPDGWHIAQIEWQIRPNPPYESLWLELLDAGTKLDYIAVYTQCVPIPAPGALLLAGIGTAMIGWMGRRRL